MNFFQSNTAIMKLGYTPQMVHNYAQKAEEQAWAQSSSFVTDCYYIKTNDIARIPGEMSRKREGYRSMACFKSTSSASSATDDASEHRQRRPTSASPNASPTRK